MRFIVRVELHNANRHQYDQLHAVMHTNGFGSQIQADTGAWYHMPPAEYLYEGTLAVAAVRDLAARCAQSVVPGVAVFVTQSAGPLAWYGLELVQKAA